MKGGDILNSKKQINKGSVKKATNKTATKKKRQSKEDVEDKPELVVKPKVYTCLSCLRHVISDKKPINCVCHNPIFAINTTFEVGDQQWP